MKYLSTIVATAALIAIGSFSIAPVYANHKDGHANPPGFENNLPRDHNNTVNTNAGGGNGGERFGTFAPLDGEQHEAGNADADPGNSEPNNQAGK